MTDFAEAWPFPHAVFDGAFDEDLLDSVLAGWPDPDDRPGWNHFSNDMEEKWAWTPAAALWPAAAELVSRATPGRSSAGSNTTGALGGPS